MQNKTLSLLLLGAALLVSGCSVTVPNIRAVSGVICDTGNCPDIGAIWQDTNTDERGRMTRAEFIDFLFARGAVNGKPAKGAAVCVSSDDWRKNETTLADLCARGKCTYEQKKVLERMMKFRQDVSRGF